MSLDSQRLVAGVLIIVTGEVDATNAARLETFLHERILPREPVVLDLSGLTFMDSMGLHVLLRLNATLRAQDTTLHLAAVHDVPARVLQITGVWLALNIHPSVEQAIAGVLSAREAHPPEPA
ncbi:STAS domain-containing protein [Nonomuraea sp. H19]|uniref:STAS domain-containing protein n=1 Tax=Nonomuraea sp. H19 TaxID=3452206 RepID=UPI003F88D1AF